MLKRVILKNESYYLAIKFFSVTYFQILRKFSAPSVRKDVNNEKSMKIIEKNLHVLSKNAKIRDAKMLKQLHYH